MALASCPCGSGTPIGACCQPLLHRERDAATPEELMRSRYTAYVVMDGGHLMRTWHPATRPDSLDLDPHTEWLGLRIIDAPQVPPDAERGEVEFVARTAHGDIHERSEFEKRRGRWVYTRAVTDR